MSNRASVLIGYGLMRRGRLWISSIRPTAANVRRNAVKQLVKPWRVILAEGGSIVKVYVVRTEK